MMGPICTGSGQWQFSCTHFPQRMNAAITSEISIWTSQSPMIGTVSLWRTDSLILTGCHKTSVGLAPQAVTTAVAQALVA